VLQVRWYTSLRLYISVCWSVGTKLLVSFSFFHVLNPYIDVCDEFGDDANFPAGTVELCPLCGCSVRVVFLVLLFLCLISKG
jgi:hypothetical protein